MAHWQYTLRKLLHTKLLIICDYLSQNTHIVRANSKSILKIFSSFSTVLRNGYSKLQVVLVISFEAIVLDSTVSKKIKLYSNYTDNKLQVLSFTAITLVCICLQRYDLALKSQVSYCSNSKVDCMLMHGGGFAKEMVTVLFLSTASLTNAHYTHTNRAMVKQFLNSSLLGE